METTFSSLQEFHSHREIKAKVFLLFGVVVAVAAVVVALAPLQHSFGIVRLKIEMYGYDLFGFLEYG